MPYKIVFMGTPDFAVPALDALHDTGETFSLVVTQPDRPKGRGRKIIVSRVKKRAMQLGLPLAQPQSIWSDDFYQQLADVKPDLIVVVAFGQRLSPAILNLPPMGAVNVHASLLPAYRGAAPIQWAIINGETVTGVTTMLMDHGVDTGDILLTAAEPITQEDTASSLHNRLAVKGAELLLDTVSRMRNGELSAIPQDAAKVSYAPLLKKGDGLIDWRLTSKSLDCFVRGMTPWPGAFTFLHGKRLKIYRIHPIVPRCQAPAGMVLESFTDELWVATADGGVSILELQGESGKRMEVGDYLKGHPIPPGCVLG